MSQGGRFPLFFYGRSTTLLTSGQSVLPKIGSDLVNMPFIVFQRKVLSAFILLTAFIDHVFVFYICFGQ